MKTKGKTTCARAGMCCALDSTWTHHLPARDPRRVQACAAFKRLPCVHLRLISLTWQRTLRIGTSVACNEHTVTCRMRTLLHCTGTHPVAPSTDRMRCLSLAILECLRATVTHAQLHIYSLRPEARSGHADCVGPVACSPVRDAAVQCAYNKYVQCMHTF
jgi:hypothetical protein